ncbi:type II RES/Xre toxin-antitoxin system antitoxin [Mucilaginibacter paludis]|nr:antitoxin Xre-like helix-turn-helix domain-containing protein [Mucilaginibacter paludis]
MKTSKRYPNLEEEPLEMVTMTREGVAFPYFSKLSDHLHFSFEDWSSFLHLSERTIQRYKKEKKAFDPIYSEKILQIELLYKKGAEVFGDVEKFQTWMDSNIVALGNIKPKDLLDTSFGINMLNDELVRIEHGIFA